jgi:transcription termination factor Rho
MSQNNLHGKTKADLTVIAQVAGMLTATEARKMTKKELLDYLLQEEGKLGQIPADKVSAAETAGRQTAGKPVAAEAATGDIVPAEDLPAADIPADEPKAKETEKTKAADKQKVKPSVRKTKDINSKDKTSGTEETSSDKDKTSSEREKTSSGKGKSSSETKGSKRSRAMKSAGNKTADSSETKAKNKEQQDLDHDPDNSNDKPDVEVSPQELFGGVLEIMQDNYGFLRMENYLQSNNDIYVPPQYIRRFNLRTGDYVVGPVRKQRDDRYQALYYVKEVNGQPPDKVVKRPHFDRLTPIYPNERYVLETTRQELSTRIIDLVAPIGKGQRGMIVSPPKAGKTILLQKIAKAIATNNPEAKLIVLLIDERPEEVTDMQRSIDGEVVYSTFDKTPENHVKVTELVLERAKRLVELGQDVVILLDSVTRMGRAYNLTITPTGRTLSGGLDPGALYGPKRFFGAARNVENGGSLTIIATALIETGSRMDEVIFEEFKGTGNMEVLLDRKLSEKRIFPAIDITRSSTRREELLLSPKELDAVWGIRKAFGSLDTAAVTETIISLLMKTRDNEQFISSINISLNDKSVFEAMRGNIKPNNGKRND